MSRPVACWWLDVGHLRFLLYRGVRWSNLHLMERVLVTGGAGYVGSHAAAHLLETGYSVVVVDDLSSGHRAAVPDGAVFREVDITDRVRLGAVFEELAPTAVLHFAARSIAPESMSDAMGYFDANVGSSLALLEQAVKHDVRKVVLSSTAHVYGRRARSPVDESQPVEPCTPYGESKHMVERMLFWLHRTSGLRAASLRYFNAAGADPSGARGEDHHPITRLVPVAMASLLGKSGPVRVHGHDYDTPDGTCVRDYVHVQDLAEAHERALRTLDEHGHFEVNLGSGVGHSVAEVLDAVRRITGRELATVPAERRPGDPATLIADGTRAEALLGFRPSRSDLTTIIESAWRWHREHPDGYE